MRSIVMFTTAAAAAALATTAFAADVTGKWSGEVKLPNGNALPFVANLNQQGAAVTGTLEGINGAPDVQIMNGKVDGDKVTFSGVRKINNGEVKFNYVGMVKAGAIDWSILRDDGQGAPLSSHTTKAAN